MTRAALTLLLLAAPASLWAGQIPAPGVLDPRVASIEYHESDVYELRGAVGYALDLVFAPDERFLGLAAGDIEGLSYEASANHLFLKPKVRTVATNLTILTDRHHYYCEYKATRAHHLHADGTPASDPPAYYAVRFTYPDDELRAAASERQSGLLRANEAFIRSELSRPGLPLNTNYRFKGARTLEPSQVSDDGIETTLVFPPRAEIPAVFVHNADGSESLVNFTVRDTSLVIPRIAPELTLRRGKLKGTLVNRSFAGTSVPPRAGTVSSAIERTVPTVN